ncbi:MAG: aminotransferase class V-fold PLP-dependent enzyme, partial [Spirochaetales bacterium]|nr:aminotransferase class V-fold PLP-dependent enzyme [Spirochaetales bacterium]
MQRKKNFFAGPSVMPVEVLQELQAQILDYNGQGLSMIETSHRGGLFEDLHIQALSLVRELLGISDEYSVFFLGGGASLQFSMVPMNFLRPNT